MFHVKHENKGLIGQKRLRIEVLRRFWPVGRVRVAEVSPGCKGSGLRRCGRKRLLIGLAGKQSLGESLIKCGYRGGKLDYHAVKARASLKGGLRPRAAGIKSTEGRCLTSFSGKPAPYRGKKRKGRGKPGKKWVCKGVGG